MDRRSRAAARGASPLSARCRRRTGSRSRSRRSSVPSRKSTGIRAAPGGATRRPRRLAERCYASAPASLRGIHQWPLSVPADLRLATLGLFGLREDVLAGNLVDQIRMVAAQVLLRLLPERVVVLLL